MWPESTEQARPLRSGLTTGCCATACCIAAANMLFFQQLQSRVEVLLPRGKKVDLIIDSVIEQNQTVRTATIKDAGDDPDVTHGAEVYVELSLIDAAEIRFSAAEGVGVVTREGLALAVGEAAINPVPRQMITDHLLQIAEVAAYNGGFEVAVGVINGEALAQKTMNPRLGIVGGLSILGTTGIVRPFSCSAYIASIHQGIDVAKANGINHIAATTGSSSEAAIRDYYQLGDMALIEMGDFVGAVLKYLRRVPVDKLTLCGGFGKLTKLANGHLDLHSKSSSINFAYLASKVGQLHGSSNLQRQVLEANTSIEVLAMCQKESIDLVSLVCQEARQVAEQTARGQMSIEVFAINRQGKIIGCDNAATDLAGGQR
ncbi:Cobalt-precorrin-5B C(1)-methyltransferase [Sinobacterium norvegicum]|uniref:Cobalt-precorrin-5B C(1)-methyltransferase n=1 Tax=Sinobacterium norvegicum TaxID=1641715 RepID=A0ABM9AKT0_9GAMM|nr:cobalt-precorrin-5B (C(1))-methyltransferase [Sinobacterium norvegicum]CAH0993377.1 Cobalt-precorrin-5B C(1)-methyltransferase [Sinobacterium norvegicum]